MSNDHLYYHHVCQDCHREYHDALPMRLCKFCLSDELVVNFDECKRTAALGQLADNGAGRIPAERAS